MKEQYARLRQATPQPSVHVLFLFWGGGGGGMDDKEKLLTEPARRPLLKGWRELRDTTI